MNTPGHAIVSLFVVGRDGDSPRRTLAILVGAVVPDAPMFFFYVWERLIHGMSESQIWSERYFDPTWQAVFDTFNSIPFAVLGALIAWRAKVDVALVFFLSILVHIACDMPLHHDDGHRHFFPFSDFRFDSPVSYWDPQHYGSYGALFEMGFVMIASLFLWRRFENRAARITLVVINVLYLASYVGFYIVGPLVHPPW